jgi:dihydroxy-acid dehydratase
VRDGDSVVVDVSKRQLNLEVPEAEIVRRLKDWRPPAPHYQQGVFAKYAALVSSASEGAVTRPR